MKLSKYTFVKGLFFFVNSVFIFFYLVKVVQPELHYHVQQPAFFSTWNFFFSFLNTPGGISRYVSNFLSQFFYYKWIGSLIILSVGLLIVLFGHSILKKLRKDNFAWFIMFLPLILIIALLNNYNFPFVIIVRIFFIVFFLWLQIYFIHKAALFYIFFSIFGIIIYIIAGSGSLLIFSVSSVLLFFIKKTQLFFLGFAFLYTFLIDFIAFNYVFAISPETAYFSFLQEIDLTMDILTYQPHFLFYIFCFSFPFIWLIVILDDLMFNYLKQTKADSIVNLFNSQKFIIHLGIASLITLLTLFVSKITINIQNKNIYLADYYCYNENWEKVIDIALSEKEYNVFLNFCYNRAIRNSGDFTDKFFNYPQYHTMALYPDKSGTPEYSLITSDYYFDLGYISISQQWAYGSLTLMPNNPRILKRLVLTNLIYGNYEASENLLNVLSNNFVTKKFAEKYMPYVKDTFLVANDKLIVEKRSSMPDNIVISEDIRVRLSNLLEKNNKNKSAYEHLQMCHLMAGNFREFLELFQEYQYKFNKTPKVYEEAILMYHYVRNKEITGLSISDESKKVFKAFTDILIAYDNNREQAKPALGKYSNSYLFYSIYNSPFSGNK